VGGLIERACGAVFGLVGTSAIPQPPRHDHDGSPWGLTRRDDFSSGTGPWSASRPTDSVKVERSLQDVITLFALVIRGDVCVL
jgi:hypothetical protein